MLNLALAPGKYYGWGVCSRYLSEELAKEIPVRLLHPDDGPKRVPGPVFHAIGDWRLLPVFDVKGSKNYGYTFFENLLTEESVKNAGFYDLIFAGSTWCRNRLEEKGIGPSRVLLQGIDPENFYPLGDEKPGAKDYFVVFSGGKFELRKGQDLVIKAVAVLQQRHKDVLLVTCWHNFWPFSMNTMAWSPWISYRPQAAYNQDYIRTLLVESGVDLDRTEMLPVLPEDQLAKIYACTDVGLFPNRCEGGTNLVLMEYMACARPAIVSYTSGHKDVATPDNSLLLTRLRPFILEDEKGNRIAQWQEPELEEIIETLEFAYKNPGRLLELKEKAGRDLSTMTWKNTALNLLKELERDGVYLFEEDR